MFDFNDPDQESIRSQWYPPIGEYVLLFSNLEFMLAEWINLLSESRALKNVITNLPFSRKLRLLFDIIDECRVDNETKTRWKHEWQKVKPLLQTRNLICHNPPINNFDLTYTDGRVLLKAQKVEILSLRKPLGEPGSGLSLPKLKKQTNELRKLLRALDDFHTDECLKP